MGAGEESGEKNFDASASKLQRLREQGSVPKSQEVGRVLTLAAAVIYLVAGSTYIWGKIYSMFIGLWSVIHLKNLSAMGAGFIIEHSFKPLAFIIVPLIILTASAAVISSLGQVGFLFTMQSMFKGINPFNYFKNLFSIKGVKDLLKEIIKIVILGFVAYKTVNKHWLSILGLLNANGSSEVAGLLKQLITDFMIEALIALFIVAVADFVFEKLKFAQDQKMTLQEVIKEGKESEGDPQMKGKRRQMAREMTQRKQLASLPEADFITTNPYKIAVAIKYNSKEMKAPKVIAKGGDSFAWQIISAGKKNNIPIIENIPLARALYKLVKVGNDIPPELYRATAEILLFAYQIRGKKSS